MSAVISAPFLLASSVQWARFSRHRERGSVPRFEQRQVQSRYGQRAHALLLIA